MGAAFYFAHQHDQRNRKQDADEVESDIPDGSGAARHKALMIFIRAGVQKRQQSPSRQRRPVSNPVLPDGAPDEQGQYGELHHVCRFSQDRIPDSQTGTEARLG